MRKTNKEQAAGDVRRCQEKGGDFRSCPELPGDIRSKSKKAGSCRSQPETSRAPGKRWGLTCPRAVFWRERPELAPWPPVPGAGGGYRGGSAGPAALPRHVCAFKRPETFRARVFGSQFKQKHVFLRVFCAFFAFFAKKGFSSALKTDRLLAVFYDIVVIHVQHDLLTHCGVFPPGSDLLRLTVRAHGRAAPAGPLS